MEDKQTVTRNPKGEKIKAVRSSRKRTRKKKKDSDKEDEDSSDKLEEVVANWCRKMTPIEADVERFRKGDDVKLVTTVENGIEVCKISCRTRSDLSN